MYFIHFTLIKYININEYFTHKSCHIHNLTEDTASRWLIACNTEKITHALNMVGNRYYIILKRRKPLRFLPYIRWSSPIITAK